jgi:hypothetical protein
VSVAGSELSTGEASNVSGAVAAGVCESAVGSELAGAAGADDALEEPVLWPHANAMISAPAAASHVPAPGFFGEGRSGRELGDMDIS